jgi:tetratricopeptide (TPR) repeat protein
MKITRFALVALILVLVAGTAELRAADDGLSSVLDGNSAAKPADPAPEPSTSSQPPEPSDPHDGLARVNAAIQFYPNNPAAYIVRGNIYSEKKKWDDARKDYEKALTIDPQNAAAEVNLAELDFRLKQYDQARAGFLSIATDKDLGDLASYMVLLCDLYNAHDAAAGQELAAFNAAGKNASYYFGNIAWDLFHRNVNGARDYLQSAQAIYPPGKIRLYESNLVETGYLPLKD